MYFFYFLVILILLPKLIYAQGVTLLTIITTFTGVVNNFIIVIATFALVFFIWGVIKMISANSDNERIEGKKRMVWGIIALFVIFSIWGIIAILVTIFGVQNVGGTHLAPIIQWGQG